MGAALRADPLVPRLIVFMSRNRVIGFCFTLFAAASTLLGQTNYSTNTFSFTITPPTGKILVTDTTNTISVLISAYGTFTNAFTNVNVKGTYFTQTNNLNVAGANIIAIADVNGDGLNDLVITDPGPTGGTAPTVNVLLQDAANHGTFLAPVSYPIATQDLPQSIVVTDLQGTGKLDIVIGGRQSVTVLLHDPATAGKFLPAGIYAAAYANEIAVADINGDGKPDIVVSSGVSHAMQAGVATNNPGVLLQSATASGVFGALQELP